MNLIPFNPIGASSSFRASTEHNVKVFQKVLRGTYNIRTTIRQQMGEDISGACGQLVVNLLEQRSAGGVSLLADIEDLRLWSYLVHLSGVNASWRFLRLRTGWDFATWTSEVSLSFVLWSQYDFCFECVLVWSKPMKKHETHLIFEFINLEIITYIAPKTHVFMKLALILIFLN